MLFLVRVILILSIFTSKNAYAEWTELERNEQFDFGLKQEWNIPPLKDDFYSILMSRHTFRVDNSGAWRLVWDWCNQDYTNRCIEEQGEFIATYITIYKIDCFQPSKKFQIINSYWLGVRGGELHWNMGVDSSGNWIDIIKGDILEKRLLNYKVCD